ncbi:FAD-binding protein [Octadecabacter ascidiaceicola]|uniref:Putative FAD-linked oxidoreductase n=1 Tax=Octadecabacter ascidiaceicola TaxID=1655543 RepID=A0A238KNW1_9RHOB|nr:FAD-binding protein [Octadecabacter ascidiaceicola]SMX43706.1 putative FAD-linked oxidoreductase [Octadecabacter ascidiaceicola]
MTVTTEQELAEAVKGATGPLHICGGGTRDIGNPVVGDVLSTAGLNGISLYEPGALTIVAQAGTPVADIEAALEAENQRLAFEPMDHRTLLGTTGKPTIGGIVATNASGPRRISVGACRDHLLGVRFVDGAGTTIKNGGRVMKNVTGYDLVKLMAGSYGTLGVLSEVSLKVLPRAETQATLCIFGLDETTAADAMSAALGSPYEVSGAAWDVDRTMHLRLEGFENSVNYRVGKLADLIKSYGEVQIVDDPTASERIWVAIRNVDALAGKDVVVRMSIQPSALSEMHFATRNMFVPYENGPTFDIMTDWGGGLVWIGADANQLVDCAKVVDGEPSAELGGQVLVEYLQSQCAFSGGHATLIKGPGALRNAVPVFQPENPTVNMLSKGLRNKFDPRGIMNAGLMG